MSSFLCITVRFFQPYAHGRDENGDPEWPPSPLRMLQSLVAASAGRWNERQEIRHARSALQWLETLPQPQIVASPGVASNVRCQFYVPDNTADLLVSAWKKGDVSKQPKRTEKVVCPTNLEGDAVHYLFAMPNGDCPHIDTLTAAARSVTHLGWGIDMAFGDARIISAEDVADLSGHRWLPSPTDGTPLRTPKSGTLDDLSRKHFDFLHRLSDEGFRPVPPLRAFDVVRYRRVDQTLQRPFRVFELRNTDGSRFRYAHSRFVHIAGMVRHLAIEAMTAAPPRGVESNWVERFVAGHRADRGDSRDDNSHRQLSYLPLPSIGMAHTDPAVRRVMIAAPVGDEAWLNHVARRLAGRILQPKGNEFGDREPPLLVPVQYDKVAAKYLEPANAWASVTPVILPGHDDHKPAKTRRLIETALAQSGIEQPCEFEWSPFSRFPKSLSAHKYDKNKRPTGYIRPAHLLSQTAVHLTVRFKDGLYVPGPLVIGAGRHCGFGLMAVPNTE